MLLAQDSIIKLAYKRLTTKTGIAQKRCDKNFRSNGESVKNFR